MSLLFQAMQLKQLRLNNRIFIAPMCQYSANAQGEVSYWHEQQWGNYAASGAGLCIVEATAVQAEGRISAADLGLWNQQQAEKMAVLLKKIKEISPMPFALQLAHAGRKASSALPWQQPQGQLAPTHEQGWQSVSASPIAYQAGQYAPVALQHAQIQQVIADFAAAAHRAVQAGFDAIELHAAHGYLLHQFLSPLSNQREDAYGGSLANRMRLTLEVFTAIREVVPQNYPVGIRISATDWMDDVGGWNLASSIELSKALAAEGVAYIHVSSGGLHPEQQIRIEPSYQVEFAEAIKRVVDVPVVAVGLITEAMQAEGILHYAQADAVAIGRSMLYDPRWPWHAAAELGETIEIAPQYLRCQPHGFRELFAAYRV